LLAKINVAADGAGVEEFNDRLPNPIPLICKLKLVGDEATFIFKFS
jgi:hypothetical protein